MKNNVISSKTSVKKRYEKPVLISSGIRLSSHNVCGWYTQCGSLVKCRS